MKIMILLSFIVSSVAFAQTSVVLDNYIVDVDETPALLDKPEGSPSEILLNLTVQKNQCLDWQTTEVTDTCYRSVYVPNRRVVVRRSGGGRRGPGRIGGGRTMGPRRMGPSYPAGGFYRQQAYTCYKSVTVCVESETQYPKQQVELNFVRINKTAQMTMSVTEDINGNQILNTNVMGLKSGCLKKVSFSKDSMGKVNSVTVIAKKRRKCRGL